MGGRPRIDLDGVSLSDARSAQDGATVLGVLRRRTREGLVVLVPESADELVPWSAVRSADLDLVSGRVRLELDPDYVRRERWLRGASALVGTWTDRVLL
jgi:hypothetical protein